MKTAIFFSTLLMATTLALPSKSLTSEERYLRRVERRKMLQSPETPNTSPLDTTHVQGTNSHQVAQSSNASHAIFSTNWAGAILEQPPAGQQFATVVGQFTVPTVKKGSTPSSYWAASAWVGIDGDTWQSAILQTGIDFWVDASGNVNYDAWYEWFPDYAYDFNLKINAGDQILMIVQATSTTTGICVIRNLTTRQTVTKQLSSSSALGGQNAEWIIEDFISGSGPVPLANWGTVTFTNAVALTSKGQPIGLQNATIIDMVDNDFNLVSNVGITSPYSFSVAYA